MLYYQPNYGKHEMFKKDFPNSELWDSYFTSIKDEYVRMWRQLNDNVEATIMHKVNMMGHFFKDREAWFDFVRQRITCVTHPEQKNVIFLDYKLLEDGTVSGIPLLSYSTKIQVTPTYDNGVHKVDIKMGV